MLSSCPFDQWKCLFACIINEGIHTEASTHLNPRPTWLLYKQCLFLCIINWHMLEKPPLIHGEGYGPLLHVNQRIKLSTPCTGKFGPSSLSMKKKRQFKFNSRTEVFLGECMTVHQRWAVPDGLGSDSDSTLTFWLRLRFRFHPCDKKVDSDSDSGSKLTKFGAGSGSDSDSGVGIAHLCCTL